MKYKKSYSSGHEETRQQGYMSFPCSAYAIRYQEDEPQVFFAKPHWHDAVEIIHFEKGIFQLTVNMETFTITEDTYAIVESGMLHAILSERDYAESAIVFAPSILSARSIDAAENTLIGPLMSRNMLLPRLITRDNPAYEEFHRVYQKTLSVFLKAGDRRDDQYNVSDAADQLKVKAYMMLLLAELAGQGQLSTQMSIPDPKVEALKQVLSYINENYQNHIYIVTWLES